MSDESWTPDLGDMVWLNYPDAVDPLGKVVGFVPGDAGTRAGQPIIEAQGDESGIRGRKKGERFVIHPMSLLPFRIYGEEWQAANAEGRVR